VDKASLDERYYLLGLQLEAYGLAIHALCLLDARDAWIAVGLNPDANPEDDASNFGGGYLPMNKSGSKDSEIVELEDMRRECELCRARKQLLFRMMELRGGKLAEEGTYGVN